MKRWRRRLQRDRIDPDAVRDSFFAFTQTCYHLVDWLENDKSQPIRRRMAEQFIEESGVLSFCRDVCNGSKHAQLDAKKVNVTGLEDRSPAFRPASKTCAMCGMQPLPIRIWTCSSRSTAFTNSSPPGSLHTPVWRPPSDLLPISLPRAACDVQVRTCDVSPIPVRHVGQAHLTFHSGLQTIGQRT